MLKGLKSYFSAAISFFVFLFFFGVFGLDAPGSDLAPDLLPMSWVPLSIVALKSQQIILTQYRSGPGSISNPRLIINIWW